MGIRTLHRRKAMATTVVVATVTVTAAVVPVLLAPVPAVAAEAATAQLPAPCRSPHDPDRGARMSRELRAALSARRGVFSGAARGPRAHIDNGRLPRAARGGRVHGIGAFTGPARTYRVVVLSYDKPTTPNRVRAIGRIARAVRHGLSRGRGLLRGPASGIAVSEE
ncbi:hypothetical protein [Streptomyces sp. NPDC002685]|uniref:hypothetical protein n=1 Tax=Streptomyces sp. NPDC002685 TaxID=3154540 RepID=UPI00332D7930